jgi:hypothetical protein
VSTAVTAVPASIAKNVDTAIDGITRAFVHKDLRDVLTKIHHLLAVFRIWDQVPFCPLDPGSGMGKKQPGSYFREELQLKIHSGTRQTVAGYATNQICNRPLPDATKPSSQENFPKFITVHVFSWK